MGVVPCPVCGWQIPDHMARPAIVDGAQRTRCPNEACSRLLIRRRRGAGWGPWEDAEAGHGAAAG